MSRSATLNIPAEPVKKTTGAAGLEGVVAAPSDICFIDGVAGRLVYRGYEIGDLVENLHPYAFEQVCCLLWDGKLPNAVRLEAVRHDLAAAIALPPHVLAVLAALPKQTEPMDALRTAASSLSSVDPDLKSTDGPANRRMSIRLAARGKQRHSMGPPTHRPRFSRQGAASVGPP